MKPLSEASRSELGSIARGGALNLAGAAFSAVGGFLVIVVVTRTVSDTQAGTLFAATSVFMIATALALLGTDTGLARFVLRFEAHGRHGDIPTTIRLAVGPVVVVSCAVGITLAAAAGVVAPWVGLTGPAGTALLRVVALAIPFATLADVALSATRAFGRMRPTVAVDSVLRTSLQLAFITVAGWAGAGEVGLGAAWVAPYLVAAAIAVPVTRRVVADRRTAQWDRPATPKAQLRREFWGYTWPRGLARLTQIAIQRVDIVIIAVLLDTRAAAIYTAATRFVVFGQLTAQAMYRILQPRFSEMIARGEADTTGAVFRVSTAWSMAMSWPVYLVVACGAPIYLRIFGGGYVDDGVPVVVAMAIAMMLATAAGPLDTLLLMGGGSAASLVIGVVSLALDVVLCLLLIPPMGILGAALAWGAAVLTKNILTWWQVHRRLGVSPLSTGSALVAVACLVCLALPLLGVGYLTDQQLLPFAIAAVVGAFCYSGVLWLARGPLALDTLRAVLRRAG